MKVENSNDKKEYEVEIKRSKEKIVGGDLDWTKEEFKELEKRVLNLKSHQIGSLASLLVGFKKEDIENVVSDIKENGSNSGHLSILIYEAPSKEDLLWWLDYFEKHNK